MKENKYPKSDEIKIRGNQIYSPVRKIWVQLTPEEKVRQDFLRVLIDEYAYGIDQIAEEEGVTGRGSAKARADFVIWRTIQDRRDNKTPLIVIECKADNVAIDRRVYEQGENYARLTNAPFFVTYNHRETKFWRVIHDKMPKNIEEIDGIPHADATDKEIQELLDRLKIFKEDEFTDLLHQCHNVIRNREKKDPAAAFDEIAKILFVKVDIERRLRKGKARKNLFTAKFLDEQSELHDDPMNVLFKQTKDDYKTDKIFDPDETINLKFNTAREIVKLLERYNLSDTSEDIKGIAFERFLGRTFRGDIGQFFTPRTIVEFMVRMLDPKEGDIICDPASGSGGFLIRFFEIVRQQILADADRQYQEFKAQVEAKSTLSKEKKAEMLRKEYDEIQETLDPQRRGSRLWNLANQYIYGTDANDRMARTSKMNMIMHGDGHGGVHHHDGFINVNGIFEGRFDIILTNPPFGANVEESDIILESDTTTDEEAERLYSREFGQLYSEAQAKVRAAKGKPIASLFELPKNSTGKGIGKIKTEILFIERCLSLLKPGGRMGIVLPEGVFNNPSLAYGGEFCEDRAYIKAVVSLPQETFFSIGASVKASLLFMQKFTENEKADFEKKRNAADLAIRNKHMPELERETARLEGELEAARLSRDSAKLKKAQFELRDFQRKMEKRIQAESRALLKERFAYPVFLYAADKVGITSTGEADQNELFPHPNQPPGTEGKTCLEVYRAFIQDPKPFLEGRA